MATSDVKVTPGSGKNVATYSFTEDAETKEIQRIVINKSDGTELGSSTAIKVDNSGVTQPVSGAVTANLGTIAGVATAAKQPALGTAGTASADVITVQGKTSMTPVLTDGSATTQPISGTVTANAGTNLNTSALALDTSVTGLQVAQGSTTSGQSGSLIQTATTTAAPTYVTAKTNPLSTTTAGALRIDGSGATQPVSGTVTTTPPSNASTNVAQINAVTPLMGNGTTGTGSQRVTVASDNTPFPVKTDQTTHGTTDLVAADITKVAGSAISQGHGTAAAAIRVELPTDGTGVIATVGAVTAITNALPAGSNVIGHVIADTGSTTAITGTVVTDDLAAAPTGAAVPANAQYQGGIAKTALPTAASDGNLTGTTIDKFGRQVVLQGTIRDLVGTQTTTITASTSETTIVTAAANVFNDLNMLVISNTSATAVRLDFRDTTAGSVLFSLYVPAGDTRGFSPPRPIPQTSVNTNWTAQSSASITDLRIYAVYDKNK